MSKLTYLTFLGLESNRVNCELLDQKLDLDSMLTVLDLSSTQARAAQVDCEAEFEHVYILFKSWLSYSSVYIYFYFTYVYKIAKIFVFFR